MRLLFFMEKLKYFHHLNYMVRLLTLNILLIFLAGCVNNSDERLVQKIDSLQKSLQTLEQKIAGQNNQDTIKNDEQNEMDTSLTHQTVSKKILNAAEPKNIQDSLKSKKQIQITTPSTKQTDKSTGAETSVFYYYQSMPKSVSVEITSWHDGKRELIFFDPFGNKTYSIKDIRRSFSSTTELKRFHKNGACSLAKISINPDASMYWYETEINFDENNNPQWKTELQFPQESTEQNLNNRWWWNEKSKNWVRQQIIEEQPVPQK